VDLTDSPRVGSFPFFKLPLEIRHKVYLLFVDPFCHALDEGKRILIVDIRAAPSLQTGRNVRTNLKNTLLGVNKRQEKIFVDGGSFPACLQKKDWLSRSGTTNRSHHIYT